jgi:hypothetical protein
MDAYQVALQVPGMAVLACIVYFFLKHLKTNSADFKETIDSQNRLTETCVDRMVKTHEKTVDSLDRNTEMFGRVEIRLDQLTELERKRLDKTEE